MALIQSTFVSPTHLLPNYYDKGNQNFTEDLEWSWNTNLFRFDEEDKISTKMREKLNILKTTRISDTGKVRSEEDSVIPLTTLIFFGFLGSNNDEDSETSSIESIDEDVDRKPVQENLNLLEDFRVYLRNREIQYDEFFKDLPESVDFEMKNNFLLENEVLTKLVDIIQLMLFLEKLPMSHKLSGIIFEKYLEKVNRSNNVKFTPDVFYDKFLRLLQNMREDSDHKRIMRKISKLRTYSIISENFPALHFQRTGNFQRKAILKNKLTAFLFSKMIIIGKNKEKYKIKDIGKVSQKFSKKTIVLTMKNKKEIVLLFDDFEEMDLWYKYLCRNPETAYQENLGFLDIKNRIFN